MSVKDSDANVMLADYAGDALRLLEQILNDQIASAQRALKEVDDIRKGDIGHLPGAIKRTLKWAEPSNGSRENLEHSLESIVFWYGVKQAQDAIADDEVQQPDSPLSTSPPPELA